MFLDIAALNGLDSGHRGSGRHGHARRALAPDRDTEGYRMAADFIEGRDQFGMDFIEAFRAGRFEAA